MDGKWYIWDAYDLLGRRLAQEGGRLLAEGGQLGAEVLAQLQHALAGEAVQEVALQAAAHRAHLLHLGHLRTARARTLRHPLTNQGYLRRLRIMLGIR